MSKIEFGIDVHGVEEIRNEWKGGNSLSWISCLGHGNRHKDGVHQSFS